MFNKKSLENFWYYNKIKVIIASVAIVLAIFIILHDKEIKSDVEVAYVTDGRTITKEADEYINRSFAPVIQDVTGDHKKKIGFVPLEGIRIDVEFVAEGSQIVLVDENLLGILINTGVFEPLDALIDKNKLDLSNNSEANSKIKGKNNHIYAIPVKYLPILQKAGYPADNYFLTIRATDSKNKTIIGKNRNAHAIVEAILENLNNGH